MNYLRIFKLCHLSCRRTSQKHVYKAITHPRAKFCMTCTQGLVISELTIRKYAENWMTHKRHYAEF